MEAPGHVKHSARGDLVIGAARESVNPQAARPRLERVARLLEDAHIGCRIVDDIAPELWTKLVLNCAYNAVSALTRMKYGRMVEDADTRRILAQLVDETVAVARACGVELSAARLQESTVALGRAMPDAISSMAQDIGRGRRTEIDSLNGYVARTGARLGIATPINDTLASLVRLLESPLPRSGARE